jgi:hypothetical protein
MTIDQVIARFQCMTIDQVIAFFASIGACMSAIAAFFAVRQNTKQREASYRPVLAITKTIFTASKNPISESSFADLWIEDKDDRDFGKVNLLSCFSIPLRNVGLGAAKEVSLNWSFKIADIVSNINSITQRSLIPAYFELHNEVLSLNSKDHSAGISMWCNQKQDTVDYVLPASTDRVGVNIRIPPAYIKLVSALLYFSVRDHDSRSFTDMPMLKLALEYFDIGGCKHKASFNIELTIVSISGSGEQFQGYMQSKEIV